VEIGLTHRGPTAVGHDEHGRPPVRPLICQSLQSDRWRGRARRPRPLLRPPTSNRWRLGGGQGSGRRPAGLAVNSASAAQRALALQTYFPVNRGFLGKKRRGRVCVQASASTASAAAISHGSSRRLEHSRQGEPFRQGRLASRYGRPRLSSRSRSKPTGWLPRVARSGSGAPFTTPVYSPRRAEARDHSGGAVDVRPRIIGSAAGRMGLRCRGSLGKRLQRDWSRRARPYRRQDRSGSGCSIGRLQARRSRDQSGEFQGAVSCKATGL
jgi:hypothetical protein